MPRRWDILDRFAFAAFLAILVIQLFIPPVLGLANSGDFSKVTGTFGLYSPAPDYTFAPTTYVFDPKYVWHPGFLSSELLLAKAAIAIDRVFVKPGVFDLRCIGLVHGALYALAFGLALPLLHGLSRIRRAGLIGLALLIFGDVLYVSALNSFYMDTAAFVFLCLAVVLYLRAARWRRMADRAALALALGLLLTSKTQHVLLSCVAFVLVVWNWRELGGSWMSRPVVGAVWAASLTILHFGTPAGYSETPAFNVIFWGLMPQSKDVAADLTQLGLDSGYRKYVGMHAYSTGAPMNDQAFVEAFGRRTGYGRIGKYYATHPRSAFRVLWEEAMETGRQRPDMGNYDPATGAKEFQQSKAFSIWSGMKQALFWKHATRYLAYLVALLSGMIGVAWWRRRSLPAAVVLGAYAFVVMTVLEWLTSSLGDVLDVIRHHFVFTATSDIAFLMVAAMLLAGGANPTDPRSVRCKFYKS